jgi:hypothetical protein
MKFCRVRLGQKSGGGEGRESRGWGDAEFCQVSKFGSVKGSGKGKMSVLV